MPAPECLCRRAVRILVYSGPLCQDLLRAAPTEALPPVLPVVLHHGAGRWTAPEAVAGLAVPGGALLAPYPPAPAQRYCAALLDTNGASIILIDRGIDRHSLPGTNPRQARGTRLDRDRGLRRQHPSHLLRIDRQGPGDLFGALAQAVEPADRARKQLFLLPPLALLLLLLPPLALLLLPLPIRPLALPIRPLALTLLLPPLVLRARLILLDRAQRPSLLPVASVDVPDSGRRRHGSRR